MIKIKIDVIGGGLSGLSASIAAKTQNKDLTVIVHEKYGTLGYNHEGRRCGEAHSMENEWKKWHIPDHCIFNRITDVEIHIGPKRYDIARDPQESCILNRQAFIAHLGKKAEDRGVIIQTKDRITDIKDLDGDYIIDASGCPSSVKRQLGLNHGIKGVSYQQTLRDCNAYKSNKIKIMYCEKFGYFWVFPRDPRFKEVNVGFGFLSYRDYNLKTMIEEFKQKENISGTVSYVSGGLIPIGIQRPLKYHNILFVGDAGVGTFPYTGQGIYRALISGDDAGRLIASGMPGKYPYIMNQKFIKWDVVGKSFIYANQVFRRINPKLVLASFNSFISVENVIHL
ncbi:MAG: NAD(P)/FAD-dependent oxidoreductase [Candidatus Thermoplasmatota archaeon]|nr:NAD(P)/FAD-dependent oxidoreductase [Candidatus Thermoplasmatota archaeon]MBU1940746.1 NAD(P)/FAD-dependent oxidoreductase [Candidatus Thermoplasmatota archaeon]